MNNKVISKTKQDLTDAFWILYCEKRIEKITIREITTTAGYNRSTFYEYFTDIYDVLEQLEASLIPTLYELPPISLLNNSNADALDIFIQLYECNEKYYSVLLGDNGDPAFASKLKNAIKPILTEALASDINLNEIELDFILEYLLSSMISIMSYWFKRDKVLPASRLILLIKGIIENGITGVITKT